MNKFCIQSCLFCWKYEKVLLYIATATDLFGKKITVFICFYVRFFWLLLTLFWTAETRCLDTNTVHSRCQRDRALRVFILHFKWNAPYHWWISSTGSQIIFKRKHTLKIKRKKTPTGNFSHLYRVTGLKRIKASYCSDKNMWCHYWKWMDTLADLSTILGGNNFCDIVCFPEHQPPSEMDVLKRDRICFLESDIFLFWVDACWQWRQFFFFV